MRPRGNEFGVYPKNIRGSIIFYYWFYDSNGKRCFRSTGRRNPDDAIKYCRTLQIKGQLYSTAVLSFTMYTEQFFIYGKCPYINHRLSRGHTYGRSWAKRQKRLLDTIIGPYFNQTDMRAITFNDIDKFIMSLRDQKYSNKKINHVITTLKNIFSYAEMNRVIETNPCIGLKPFKVTSPEKGILTQQELKALFNEENQGQIWPEPIHFAFNYIAAFTGLRLGEILALKPKNLNGHTLIVSHSYCPYDGLKSTKNGKTRIIPLDEKLHSLLMGLCQGKQPDDFIFSNNGIRPIDHKGVYKRYWKALGLIGIDKEERLLRHISFHSYRHGVNSLLLQSGMRPELVRLILGHSGTAMTAHYSHLQLPNILELQENLQAREFGNTAPSYIKKLVDKGLIYPDGKRVKKSLKDVALELQRENIQPTEKFLMELFVRSNGESYSRKACKQAVNYANSK